MLVCMSTLRGLAEECHRSLSISSVTGCGKVIEASLSSDLAKALKCTLNFKYLTNPADGNRTTCMLKCFTELEVNELKC